MDLTALFLPPPAAMRSSGALQDAGRDSGSSFADAILLSGQMPATHTADSVSFGSTGFRPLRLSAVSLMDSPQIANPAEIELTEPPLAGARMVPTATTPLPRPGLTADARDRTPGPDTAVSDPDHTRPAPSGFGASVDDNPGLVAEMPPAPLSQTLPGMETRSVDLSSPALATDQKQHTFGPAVARPFADDPPLVPGLAATPTAHSRSATRIDLDREHPAVLVPKQMAMPVVAPQADSVTSLPTALAVQTEPHVPSFGLSNPPATPVDPAQMMLIPYSTPDLPQPPEQATAGPDTPGHGDPENAFVSTRSKPPHPFASTAPLPAQIPPTPRAAPTPVAPANWRPLAGRNAAPPAALTVGSAPMPPLSQMSAPKPVGNQTAPTSDPATQLPHPSGRAASFSEIETAQQKAPPNQSGETTAPETTSAARPKIANSPSPLGSAPPPLDASARPQIEPDETVPLPFHATAVRGQSDARQDTAVFARIARLADANAQPPREPAQMTATNPPVAEARLRSDASPARGQAASSAALPLIPQSIADRPAHRPDQVPKHAFGDDAAQVQALSPARILTRKTTQTPIRTGQGQNFGEATGTRAIASSEPLQDGLFPALTPMTDTAETRSTDARGSVVNTPPAPRPEHLASQVAHRLAALPTLSDRDAPLELTLDPPELGTIRVSVSRGPEGMVLHLQADLPETLDLLRRHGGALAQELGRQGLDQTGFSFSSEHHGGRQTPSGPGSASSRDQPAFVTPTPPPTPQVGVRSQAGGLDLRL